MSDELEKAAKEHANQVVKTECKVAGNKGCLLTDIGETILRAEAERSFKAGWKASQEWRPIDFEKVVDSWKSFWMNQTQNNEEDRFNYFNRVMGVDSNMKHHLVEMLEQEFTKHNPPKSEETGR